MFDLSSITDFASLTKGKADPFVRVHSINVDPTSRLELSAGTRDVTVEDQPPGPGGGSWSYEAGARIPLAPWRSLTNAEASLLVATKFPDDMSRCISLVKIAERGADLRRRQPKRKISALLQKIVELGEPMHCIGYGSGMPSLVTTTIDWNVRQYIGLHVDNWDSEPLESRECARNRICVNIGESTRYFLYLPIPLVDVAKSAAKEIAEAGISEPDYTEMGRLFMRRYPFFPIIRCRVNPNEAYIAPTENLVHDGSSLGQTGQDEHFTVLGRIQLSKSSAAVRET